MTSENTYEYPAGDRVLRMKGTLLQGRQLHGQAPGPSRVPGLQSKD